MKIVGESSAPKKGNHGFTIVELLIVIVVIGILAAITIVAYGGIQGRAQVASVSTGLEQTAKQLALYLVDSSNYPTNLATIGINNTGATSYQYSVDNTVTPPSFCVTAINGSAIYRINSANPTPSNGVCDGHLVGGVLAVTNLVTNPSLETGLNGWGNFGCSSFTSDSSTAKSGSNSAKCISNTTGVQFFTGPIAPALPNTAYRVSGWVRSDQNRQVEIYLAAQNAVGTELMRVNSNYVTLTPNTWVYATAGGTTPAGTTRIDAQLNFRSSIIGEQSWVDSLIYTQSGSSVNFGDGNSPNWTWNGASNNSTSTGPAL
ncbi:carbohydrate binding domain-containing protein [Candidatus Saccharibacteria bacterium]|nr:carbohydrate binding domain-containing protein [Candidatus Saccharibacteria bacterium]